MRHVHTTTKLQTDDFQYQSINDSDRIDRSDVMPTITPSDRLGMVLQQPFGGIGASNFVLSCMTAFYDVYRKENEVFLSYPDYFTFQSSNEPVDYLWFDIWPDHKNVETERDAETILRAINDRAINILLVPEEVPSTESPDFEDHTMESAERRIEYCYIYSQNGILTDADFSIQMPKEPTWEWIQDTLETISDDKSELRERREEEWRDLTSDGSIIQEFRQISLEEAICRFPNKI